MTMPEEQFRELMHRTMQNLRIIDRLAEESPGAHPRAFEVTQLVNSFLGALAMPRERDLRELLQGRSILEAEQRWGLPPLEDEYPDRPRLSNREKYKP
jgi:hypothetical protein